MKRIAIAGLVVAGVLVALESSAAPAAEEAIKHVFVQIDQCLANNDAKCVGELLVEDATYSEAMADAKIIKGRTQITKTLEDLMGGTPNAKGAKPTHTVENIRMVGTDHAIVDSTIQFAGMKPEGEGADAPRHKLRTLAVMVLKGDKWLFQDLRNYIVGPEPTPPKQESAPPAKNEPAPSAKKKSTPPAKEPAPPAVQ